MNRWNFRNVKKIFYHRRGEERATIRESLAAAEKKRQKLAKYSGGKKIFIFKAEERS